METSILRIKNVTSIFFLVGKLFLPFSPFLSQQPLELGMSTNPPSPPPLELGLKADSSNDIDSVAYLFDLYLIAKKN